MKHEFKVSVVGPGPHYHDLHISGTVTDGTPPTREDPGAEPEFDDVIIIEASEVEPTLLQHFWAWLRGRRPPYEVMREWEQDRVDEYLEDGDAYDNLVDVVYESLFPGNEYDKYADSY